MDEKIMNKIYGELDREMGRRDYIVGFTDHRIRCYKGNNMAMTISGKGGKLELTVKYKRSKGVTSEMERWFLDDVFIVEGIYYRFKSL